VVLFGAGCPPSAPPPLAIDSPSSGEYFSENHDLITLRIRYNDEAMPLSADGTEVQLEIRLNGDPVPLAVEDVGPNETTLSLSTGMLDPGRNFISAFLPSSNAQAALNGGFLVKHRVFSFKDLDGDGLPKASDPADSDPDADGDGFLDSVESHGVGTEGLPNTVASGAIAITDVRPNPLIPGRAVALLGAGLEAIDAPGEVSFNGIPALETAADGIPGLTITRAPSSLDAGGVTIALQDASGISNGAVGATVDATHATVLKNLVLVSGIFAQAVFASDGTVPDDRVGNAALFHNFLQFGTSTRVLVDGSRVSPDLQTLVQVDDLYTAHGVGSVQTLLLPGLSAQDLQDVDLLILLVSDPPSPYSPGELDAIAGWIETPGRRLVVVSDACCGQPISAATTANQVLSAVGAASHFDPHFLSLNQQEVVPYLTGGVFSDPPLTTGVGALFYLAPGAILLGAGSHEAARAGICTSGEVGITQPNPVNPDFPLLVACEDLETGQQLPVIEATYVASETLATSEPVVELTQIGLGTDLGSAFPVSSQGLVVIPPIGQITVEARFGGFTPSAATVSVGSAMQSAAIDLATGTLTASGLPFDSLAPVVEVRVVASDGATTVSDAILVRGDREAVLTRFVVFADQNGHPVIDADVLAAAQRQAGLELQALCAGASDAATGAPLTPLSAHLAFANGVPFETVVDTTPEQQILELVAFDAVQSSTPTQAAINLAMGLNPSGSMNPSIPDPSSGGAPGPVPIRVFVVKGFKRMNPDADSDPQAAPIPIPPDPQTGISAFGWAFFGRDDAAQDLALVQARSGDLEAGPLKRDRPVASSLAHELVHVLGAVQDNRDEEPDPPNDQPVALPTPGEPSVMNSFPFFRSLEVGGLDSGVAVPDDCDVTGEVPNGQAGVDFICTRALNGFSCPDPSSGDVKGPFDFTG